MRLPHEYESGRRCRVAERNCFGAVGGPPSLREEACRWCSRCFFCCDSLGCPQAPKVSEPQSVLPVGSLLGDSRGSEFVEAS